MKSRSLREAFTTYQVEVAIFIEGSRNKATGWKTACYHNKHIETAQISFQQ
jgi:hypothetical protein